MWDVITEAHAKYENQRTLADSFEMGYHSIPAKDK